MASRSKPRTSLSRQFEHRRQALLQAERNRDIYLNECKLYEDTCNATMDRLNRPMQAASSNEQYARQLSEQKNQGEQIVEKRRQLNALYDQLDQSTRARYSKQHHELERRSNELQDRISQQIIRAERILRSWREYELRLDDIRHQVDVTQKQSTTAPRLWSFQQIQTAFTLYKVHDAVPLGEVHR